jgi:heme A synthase
MDDPYRPPQSALPAPAWKPSAKASANTAMAHRVLALFYGAAALLLGVVAFRAHHDLGDSLIAAAVIGVPTLMHAVVFVGARRRSGWARGASMAIGVMMLFAFPIGTLIGVYLVRNASKPWVPPARP